MAPDKKYTLDALIEAVDAGLHQSYQQLVSQKATSGSSLVYAINGALTEVPAAELLAQLEAVRSKAPDS